MKILVDQSGYELRNLGDLAMLQIAVERLLNLYPDASFQIFTTQPERLTHYIPDAKSVLPFGRDIWQESLSYRFNECLPKGWISSKFLQLESSTRTHAPLLYYQLLKRKHKNSKKQAERLQNFVNAIREADLVIATGGGFLTDTFQQHALEVLETIGLATQLGKPTALLGQGIGPIHSQKLLSKAREILPNVGVIGIREKQMGLPLLREIGVPESKIITTGDDAIELAHECHKEDFGNSIGINLRFAKYSGIDTDFLEILSSVLYKITKTFGAPLVSLPISFYDYKCSGAFEEPDSASIQRVLKGFDNLYESIQDLDKPLKVIQEISHCRIVITGSYHAGVFALSQGIPVIALAKSEYYAGKFLGLADQFGAGCNVILLEDQQIESRLVESITDAWCRAEDTRPGLLMAARSQIEAGHKVYQKVYELI